MASPLCPFSLAFYMDDQTKKGVIIWYIVQRIIIIIHTPLTIFLPHATPNKQIFCNMKQPPLTNVPTTAQSRSTNQRANDPLFLTCLGLAYFFHPQRNKQSLVKGKYPFPIFSILSHTPIHLFVVHLFHKQKRCKQVLRHFYWCLQ